MRRSRNLFREHPVPDKEMSTRRSGWSIRADLHQSPSPDVMPFVEWFESLSDGRERFRWALRDSLDELLDGQRTGRWCYQHLSKTEKTYLGTAVEVNLTKEFDIPDGRDLDWHIAGTDLDCKFSKDLGGWEIPMEMYRCIDHGERSGKADHAALVVWMNDDAGEWAAGVIAMTDERLRWKTNAATGLRVRAYNRDNKRRLADESAARVHWLWGGLQTDLPSNLLLRLPGATRARILSGSSGQQRVNRLFREVQNRLIGRHTVLTVGQQDDAPKRARDARDPLQREGIIVLGYSTPDPSYAQALGLPVPVQGEWISVRLVPAIEDDPRPSIDIEGSRWRRASDDDPIRPGPKIKRPQSKKGAARGQATS